MSASDQDGAQLEWEQTRAELRRLRAENQQLDGIARAAAAWCSEHPDEGTPLLRDLLHAHGYDPRHREPDPEVWFPPDDENSLAVRCIARWMRTICGSLNWRSTATAPYPEKIAGG